MSLGTLKTLVNVGKNISNDNAVPVFKTLEKMKEFEVRLYEKTKFVVYKYRTVDKKADKSKAKSDEKHQPNDQIMDHVWRLMKYTQGHNEQSLNMKFYMPVFVHIETLNNEEEPGEDDADKEIEIKLMVSLPPEYQFDQSQPNKLPLEPPKPNDPELGFEIFEQFKCYVRTFSGFAGDNDFKQETLKLRETLSSSGKKLNADKHKCICIAYDPPYKLFGRRNEVIVIAI